MYDSLYVHPLLYKWSNSIPFYDWAIFPSYIFFIQSSADGHLGGFHVLAIVNGAAWFRSSSQDKHAHILSCNWPWSVTPWRLLEIRVSVHIWLFPSSAPRTEHRGHGGSTAGLCFSLMSHFKTKVEHREAPLKLWREKAAKLIWVGHEIWWRECSLGWRLHDQEMKTRYFVHPPLEQSCVVLFIGSPGKPRFKFAACLSIVGKNKDFLDGPMAKTLCSQCRGPRFHPCQGTRSYMPQLTVHMLQLSN